MEISSDKLKRIMQAVTHAISTDETRQPLLCVNLPKGFHVWESTDGHRAAQVTLDEKEVEGLKGDTKPVGMLNVEDFKALAKALPTGKKTLTVTLERGLKGVSATVGAQVYLMRFHEGWQFPELSRVIPPTPEKPCARVGVNPRYLSEACDAGEVFAGKGKGVFLVSSDVDENGNSHAPMKVEAVSEFGKLVCVVMPMRL